MREGECEKGELSCGYKTPEMALAVTSVMYPLSS